jgi:hypothetical protein
MERNLLKDQKAGQMREQAKSNLQSCSQESPHIGYAGRVNCRAGKPRPHIRDDAA